MSSVDASVLLNFALYNRYKIALVAKNEVIRVQRIHH
jgi:hypothetical protein